MTTYVWSIDDSGLGGTMMIESMVRTCDFFNTRGLRSTWFTVPKPNGKPLTDAWKEALRAVRDDGHDIQLHGLTHADCYEFGPPIWPALSILPSLQTEFESQRDELMERYTVANLRARIDEGLDIFAQELDIHPTVFRAPCGAISKAMFEVLHDVGIDYHTCMYISGTGYNHLPHNNGIIEQEWTDAIPHRPYRWYSDVVEVPIVNEYTWRGAGERSDEFIALAKQDLDRARQESPVVVILMHTHGIASDYEHTFRFIDAVIEHVSQYEGDGFATMGALAASGALKEAANVDGPNILPV
ncbi:MAG: DUF2334 domain-containing protein [Chloroflexota bacterium]